MLSRLSGRIQSEKANLNKIIECSNSFISNTKFSAGFDYADKTGVVDSNRKGSRPSYNQRYFFLCWLRYIPANTMATAMYWIGVNRSSRINTPMIKVNIGIRLIKDVAWLAGILLTP